ncbi:hypothetical protein HK104_004118 [Borealophlyctis nickersoniae]|nr:hypothetical protein HK104_004118 [Borealophlyctis nickersoniae]
MMRLCVNLKYLELDWNIIPSATVPGAPFRILANGPFLYELSLVDVVRIREDDFEYWLQCRGKSLTLFSAEPHESFTDKILALLAQYAPNLRTAGVGYLNSTEGALTLLRGCAHLQTLSILGNWDPLDDPSKYPEVEAACSRGVIIAHPLDLTRYEDLMKEKWIGL